MKKSVLPKKACLILALCMAVYCTFTVWGDISIRLAHTEFTNGGEQIAASDLSNQPFVLLWGFRLSTLGFLCLGLMAAFEARRISALRTPFLIYLASYAWSLYLLATKTTNPTRILTSFEIFSNYAPGVLGLLGIFFLSAREELWEELKDNLAKLIILLGALIFVLAPFVESGSRLSGIRYMSALSSVLQITAIAPIFMKPRGVPRYLNYVPLAGVIICGVLIQTRLTFVLTFVQILSALFLLRKRIIARIIRPHLSSRQIVVLFVAVGCVAVAVLDFTVGPQRASTQAFGNRMEDDTRSGQAINFFAKVPLESLILGHGLTTGDEFSSQGIDGIDLGYINAAYVGGIPAAFCIFYFLVLPGIQLLFIRPSDDSLAVAPICITAGFAFLSSTVFDCSPGGVLFMMVFAGRAYAVAHRKRSHAFGRSTRPVLQHEYAQ